MTETTSGVARIHGDAPGDGSMRLWGLTSHERIERQLATIGIHRAGRDLADLPAQGPVLLIDAGYLFEPRTFAALLAHDDAVLVCPADERIAAAIGHGPRVAALAASLAAPANAAPAGSHVLRPDELEVFDGHLRRTTPPLLESYRDADRRRLESLLYGNAYKGITDFVTKWWWPRPARALVALCARLGVTPNMVTLAGLVLVIVATLLFAAGHFATGLACGWIMTLLDTVDGKLARVTVRSSRLGHVLDHGMDIVHPPFWYVYWGFGLEHGALPPVFDVGTLAIATVAGYVAGRVIEAAFHALGDCSLFAWRPFDAWFRLVTARRNPCLVILTGATLAGRPDVGFAGVALWTVASSAVLLVRLGWAAAARLAHGPLHSWLADPEQAAARHARAFRTFSGTRRAYD